MLINLASGGGGAKSSVSAYALGVAKTFAKGDRVILNYTSEVYSNEPGLSPSGPIGYRNNPYIDCGYVDKSLAIINTSSDSNYYHAMANVNGTYSNKVWSTSVVVYTSGDDNVSVCIPLGGGLAFKHTHPDYYSLITPSGLNSVYTGINKAYDTIRVFNNGVVFTTNGTNFLLVKYVNGHHTANTFAHPANVGSMCFAVDLDGNTHVVSHASASSLTAPGQLTLNRTTLNQDVNDVLSQGTDGLLKLTTFSIASTVNFPAYARTYDVKWGTVADWDNHLLYVPYSSSTYAIGGFVPASAIVMDYAMVDDKVTITDNVELTRAFRDFFTKNAMLQGKQLWYDEENRIFFYEEAPYTNSTRKRVNFTLKNGVPTLYPDIFQDIPTATSLNYFVNTVDKMAIIYDGSAGSNKYIIRSYGAPVPYEYVAMAPGNNPVFAQTSLVGFVESNSNGVLTVNTTLDPNRSPATIAAKDGLQFYTVPGGNISYTGGVNGSLTITDGMITNINDTNYPYIDYPTDIGSITDVEGYIRVKQPTSYTTSYPAIFSWGSNRVFWNSETVGEWAGPGITWSFPSSVAGKYMWYYIRFGTSGSSPYTEVYYLVDEDNRYKTRDSLPSIDSDQWTAIKRVNAPLALLSSTRIYIGINYGYSSRYFQGSIDPSSIKFTFTGATGTKAITTAELERGWVGIKNGYWSEGKDNYLYKGGSADLSDVQGGKATKMNLYVAANASGEPTPVITATEPVGYTSQQYLGKVYLSDTLDIITDKPGPTYRQLLHANGASSFIPMVVSGSLITHGLVVDLGKGEPISDVHTKKLRVTIRGPQAYAGDITKSDTNGNVATLDKVNDRRVWFMAIGPKLDIMPSNYPADYYSRWSNTMAIVEPSGIFNNPYNAQHDRTSYCTDTQYSYEALIPKLEGTFTIATVSMRDDLFPGTYDNYECYLYHAGGPWSGATGSFIPFNAREIIIEEIVEED